MRSPHWSRGFFFSVSVCASVAVAQAEREGGRGVVHGSMTEAEKAEWDWRNAERGEKRGKDFHA